MRKLFQKLLQIPLRIGLALFVGCIAFLIVFVEIMRMKGPICPPKDSEANDKE